MHFRSVRLSMQGRIAALLSALPLLLMLPSCEENLGGIKGLSLPEGSVRRQMPEYFKRLSGDINANEIGLNVDLIAFDNSAGWNAVYQHIDACMKSAGYPELTEDYENAHAGERKFIDGVYEGDLLRTYEASGLPATVTLFNFEAMKKIESYSGERNGDDARFALLILH